MTRTNRLYVQFILFSILLVGVTSCSPTAGTSTATPAPTDAPAPTPTPAPTLQPGDSERKVTVNGMERLYTLHIPPGMDGSQPVPVVFVFHGFDENMATMQAMGMTSFNDTADKFGFLVAYPTGIGLSWNAVACCGDAVAQNVDEPAFVREMLADMRSIVSVDAKRVYATGFSNGGFLSYRLACEMPDVFAAIGPVAGVMVDSPCEPQEPVSVIHVHTLNDPVVPYTGSSASGFLPVDDGITTWLEADGCTGSPQVEKQLNDILTHTAYSSCNAGTAVELYVFEMGGHTWPSKYVWDASQVMWDFFAAHPKP